jgi:hypothetical protein
MSEFKKADDEQSPNKGDYVSESSTFVKAL